MSSRASLVVALAAVTFIAVTTPSAAAELETDYFEGLEQESDDVLLLQLGVSHQPSSGSCSCLNWRHVYSTLQCGQVFELLPTGALPNFAQPGGLSTLSPDSAQYQRMFAARGQEFCSHFMTLMNNTYAVNMQSMIPLSHRGSFYDRSWCYTSASCTNLNGGASVNANFSWKVATPGLDLAISELEPPAMEQVAHESSIDFGMFVATAGYTEWLAGVTFENADPAVVQRARASGSTVVFMNAPDHDHRAIVKGQSTWLQHALPMPDSLTPAWLASTWHLNAVAPAGAHHLSASPA